MGAVMGSGAPSCLHHLIEAQARRTPQAPALAFEGERLTYAELDRRAEALARRLRGQGAAPEARIALLLERSAGLVVALLGILKSGAAYVPVDRDWPAARIGLVVEDSGALLVLTQRSLRALVAPGTPCLCIDDVSAAPEDVSGMVELPGAESLAYVIYTSGSTGRPKGVCVEHRNIAAYVEDVAARLGFEAGMQHALVSTIAADLGNTVLFPALATGGCVHVLSRERAENAALFQEYFAREAIDVLKITPSHLAALQAGGAPQAVMPRRRLILGGEACALARVRELRAAAPQCEIHNHYGPTETTVGVLTYRVPDALPATAGGTLPLGMPLERSRVHVLDEALRPCAPGEMGELHIGGAGVARGYLGRPELTAERFVADPFAPGGGARLYRTGDLGRVLAGGEIEFCGRRDHQVKIGGYRVELGEIEQALREHPDVREAAVVAREAGAAGTQLVAYVVARKSVHPLLGPPGGAAALEPAGLRAYLGARLPRHMVPPAYVVMERFPLTANGKLDRLALPAPQPARPLARYVAAEGATEIALAAIWSDLLGVPQVGAQDDFFELGGGSLVAMRMVARAREALGVDVQLRHLFERPTLRRFAETLDALAWAAQAPVAGAAPPANGGEREEGTL